MKWLWIGFGVVWGISVWLDTRRRRRAASVKAAASRSKAPTDAPLETDLPSPAREAA